MFEGQFDYLRVDTTIPSPGDFNQDGHVDAADIGPAMQVLTNRTAYETQYGVAAQDLLTVSDVNGDGVFNNADLQALLIGLKNGSFDSVPRAEQRGTIRTRRRAGCRRTRAESVER